MPHLNLTLLIGNLTRDPETYVPASGHPLCKFGLAVSKRYTTAGGEKREEVLFIDCVMFHKKAEVFQKFFHKGDPVLVRGELTMNSWQDKQTGGNRTKIELKVVEFEFIKTRAESEDEGKRLSYDTPNPMQADPPEIAEDDLPF